MGAWPLKKINSNIFIFSFFFSFLIFFQVFFKFSLKLKSDTKQSDSLGLFENSPCPFSVYYIYSTYYHDVCSNELYSVIPSKAWFAQYQCQIKWKSYSPTCLSLWLLKIIAFYLYLFHDQKLSIIGTRLTHYTGIFQSTPKILCRFLFLFRI